MPNSDDELEDEPLFKPICEAAKLPPSNRIDPRLYLPGIPNTAPVPNKLVNMVRQFHEERYVRDSLSFRLNRKATEQSRIDMRKSDANHQAERDQFIRNMTGMDRAYTESIIRREYLTHDLRMYGFIERVMGAGNAAYTYLAKDEKSADSAETKLKELLLANPNIDVFAYEDNLEILFIRIEAHNPPKKPSIYG